MTGAANADALASAAMDAFESAAKFATDPKDYFTPAKVVAFLRALRASLLWTVSPCV